MRSCYFHSACWDLPQGIFNVNFTPLSPSYLTCSTCCENSKFQGKFCRVVGCRSESVSFLKNSGSSSWVRAGWCRTFRVLSTPFISVAGFVMDRPLCTASLRTAVMRCNTLPARTNASRFSNFSRTAKMGGGVIESTGSSPIYG